MKTQVNSIFRLGAVAAVAAAFCVAHSALAQVKTPDAPDDAPPVAKTSMAPIGQKPSKAELAKQKAEEEAAGGATTTTATKQQSSGNRAAAGSGDLSNADRQFMMQAAKDGMKEVHMGQMAAQSGQSAEVKKLGNQIASDHTKANQQLMAIAEKKGVKLDTRHKMDKMSKRDMENFDQAWLGMMINDHQKDIAAFQRQAQQGTDPELRNFAKKTLPVLQKHLKMVQQAQQKMGGTSSQATTTAKKTGR